MAQHRGTLLQEARNCPSSTRQPMEYPELEEIPEDQVQHLAARRAT